VHPGPHGDRLAGPFPKLSGDRRRAGRGRADVNARFAGPHAETPLHWPASSDEVESLDALIDAGADIEAPGAVIASGTPLGDAVAFGHWQTAHRLVERGARTALWHAASE
jgi:ankyrin repeat protein